LRDRLCSELQFQGVFANDVVDVVMCVDYVDEFQFFLVDDVSYLVRVETRVDDGGIFGVFVGNDVGKIVPCILTCLKNMESTYLISQ
jgi:hypothetical protein